jgi:hypothetical protein
MYVIHLIVIPLRFAMPENMRIELDLIKFLTERVFKEFTKIFEFMKYIILYLSFFLSLFIYNQNLAYRDFFTFYKGRSELKAHIYN